MVSRYQVYWNPDLNEKYWFFFSIRLHQFVIVKLRIALLFSIIDRSFGSILLLFHVRPRSRPRNKALSFFLFQFFFSFFFFFPFLFFSLLRIIRVRDEKSRTNASLSRRNDARGERDRRATLRLLRERIPDLPHRCSERPRRAPENPVRAADVCFSSTRQNDDRDRSDRSAGRAKGSMPAAKSLRWLYTSDFKFHRKSWRDQGHAYKTGAKYVSVREGGEKTKKRISEITREH